MANVDGSWLDEVYTIDEDDEDSLYYDEDMIALADKLVDVKMEELRIKRSGIIGTNKKRKYDDRHKISKGRLKHGGSKRKSVKPAV